MAQRKTPAPPTRASGPRPGSSRTPADGAARSGASAAGRPRPPAGKRPTKSIVNQRQTPWGLIVATVLVVLFAGGVVTYAVTRSSGSSTSDNPYTQPFLADAKKIPGVTYKQEPDHTHVFSTVNYDSSPPVGGNHSQIWADCSGTVYPSAIANENAVHALEHGAIWITYRPGLAADQVATLSKLVDGQDRMLMSPYADLKTPISLQSWGYQLFVDKADDPRITQFIDALRYNPKTTPEYGAQCADPQFKAKPSTPGNPVFTLNS